MASAFTPPATWPPQLTKKWEITVGVGHSSPVVAGNRVVLHSRQGNREIVAAYDLATGKQLWQDGIEAPYSVNPAAMAHGPGPKSTPAIAGARVYTLGISGIFSAHDLNTGKLLWRKDAPKTPPLYGTASSPIVDGAVVIAFLGGQNAGALTAMDAATGAVKWEWKGDGPGYSSPIIATLGGIKHVIVQSQARLVGVNAADGRLLWEVPLKTPYEQNVVTPLVAGGLVISAGLENPTLGLSVTGTSGKGWSATPRWRNEEVSMYMSSPAASGTTLFGLSNKNRGQFFAIDATSGKTLWTTKGREAENASIVRAGDYLLLSTTNSELIVVRANAQRYEEVKRYSIANSATWAHPAYAGRTIIVKDVDKLTAWGL
ncbi:MAG TPA: PQQ-binding-like beta-propeller repeat protein [Vicinamibacterales bacterium]|nr:PQQ-binding-like beta-propeller repeat protein [Vicinamibacterales bacterium]